MNQQIRCSMFSDMLNMIQGKSSVEVPENIVDKIREYIVEPDTCTAHDVWKVMRKLHTFKYQDEIYIIAHRINKQPFQTLPLELETNIKQMFEDVVRVWPILFKNSSFLAHSYILYRLLEINNRHDLITSMNIKLSSENKVDVAWQEVCKHLEWDFHH